MANLINHPHLSSILRHAVAIVFKNNMQYCVAYAAIFEENGMIIA